MYYLGIFSTITDITDNIKDFFNNLKDIFTSAIDFLPNEIVNLLIPTFTVLIALFIYRLLK